jgi:hypothetical protein
MSKKIKIGNDKQPAPLVERNVPLYNLQTSQPLTDEGGTPLVSAADTFLTSESSSNKATSIVYTSDKKINRQKNVRLSGKRFKANGNTITVESGDGLFKDENKYRISFSSLNVIDNDLTDDTITNEETNSTGTITSFNINTSTYKTGVIILSDYSDTNIFPGQILKSSNDVDKLTIVKIEFIGKSGELKNGSRLLLPTGIENSQAVYETRVVTSINTNNECILDLNVTSNKDLFGELIKLTLVETDPVLKVEENFAAFSEVSTTLLGYPKAEEQLGLFSNVSTYGLDDDEFISYIDNSPYTYVVWETRKNKTYGKHYTSRVREVKEEAAISIESYRTPYTFPSGFLSSNYNFESYKKFNIFLKIGMLLYDTYKETDPEYSKNFLPYKRNYFVLETLNVPDPLPDGLPDNIKFFIGEEIERTDTNEVLGNVVSYNLRDDILEIDNEVTDIKGNDDYVEIRGKTTGTTARVKNFLGMDGEKVFSALLSPVNSYYENADDLFSQIDTWTEVWRRIPTESFLRPDNFPLTKEVINTFSLIQKYLIQPKVVSEGETAYSNSEPGYSTYRQTRVYLESRKSFRYQPGRISGYTFGVRASNDKTDNNSIIEWGIGNNTDDLVFQIRGSNFSIVRRSVVPLSESILEANFLDPEDQVTITKDTLNNTAYNGLENKQVYETVITRDKWNGDKLNGNGPSGWNWSAEQVTMYKIEFGWYGAIGIQFYAYVPVNNGKARWVKLHRLLIENQLKQPCMGDPYYKFKYSLIVDNHINTTIPQYLYKYGTSCYIDGGDEGTVTVNSTTSNLKTTPQVTENGPLLSTSLVGIQPKTTISNSTGKLIKNKQQIFPKELSVNCDGLTEIAIVKCKSCPEFGHTYQPNLNAGYNGIERVFEIVDASRDKLRLKILEKNSTGSGNTLTLDNVDNLRIGDVVDPANIVSGIPANTIITDINGNDITLNNSLTGSINGVLQYQPVFLNSKDLYAKVIATRVYLTYIKEMETGSGVISITGLEDRYTIAKLGTIFSDYNQTKNVAEFLVDRELPQYYSVGSERSLQILENPSEFSGRLSQYNALAASSIPVSGSKNSLNFLFDTTNDSGSYSSGQLADFRIGVTSLKPEYDGTNITWKDNQNNSVQFTDSYKLYAEHFNEGININIDGYENGENSKGRIRPLIIDNRIPRPPGSNTGICGFINIEVEDAIFQSVTQVQGSTKFIDPVNIQQTFIDAGYTYDANSYYLISDTFNAITFNPENAEVGFDSNDITQIETSPSVGSGVRFASNVIQYEDSSGNFKNIIKLSNHLPGQSQSNETPLVIWFVPIKLTSFRKSISKSFNFNPYPLYFFIEMRDGSSVNGATIKEVTQVINTYNPKWFVSKELGDSQMTSSNLSIQVGPVGDLKTTTGSLTQIPPNFSSDNRLSSALIDVQNQSQLRPYEVIDKFYVGQDTKLISLSNIFDFEKETITPDLLNTTAYFFLATSREPGNTTDVQATLTYIEQQ